VVDIVFLTMTYVKKVLDCILHKTTGWFFIGIYKTLIETNIIQISYNFIRITLIGSIYFYLVHSYEKYTYNLDYEEHLLVVLIQN